MSEETENVAEATEEAAATEEAPAVDTNEQKIMCFVSKQMVPISQTVEIEYAPRKKVRVLPKYVKYSETAEA